MTSIRQVSFSMKNRYSNWVTYYFSEDGRYSVEGDIHPYSGGEKHFSCIDSRWRLDENNHLWFSHPQLGHAQWSRWVECVDIDAHHLTEKIVIDAFGIDREIERFLSR